MEDYKGILLESGTGELEILEFEVEGRKYAINVIKVKEILSISALNKIPNSHPAISGITLVRGDVISVIDMKYVLDKKPTVGDARMTLLCEFNNLKVAFLVDKVIGIHRIKWEDIKKPDAIIENSLIIGNINYQNNILILLDFEKIVIDISPSTGISEERLGEMDSKEDRMHKRIMLADDSPLIRRLLRDVLIKAGYSNLIFFNDGLEAYNYLGELKEKLGEDFKRNVDILVTDIEMPQLDGHTLTKRIKTDKVLKSLPVIIFSSLITGDLRHKGQAVGADAQMSKPEIGQLIELIDGFLEV
ncbi:two-component system, chemotaxis family, response regulator CheV [Peptoclostridium litorale DSM 5388]|uniref:Stage 0 sporulation protein A homolog n=1 Tax=Peptoclostridium litorale DSM 5388 TaxID=1121324 RepID=A0A069RCQ9_PEPLI|nr:chemotaxis protein [Peptoclostridium litorale]KDR94548.1 chemotaxis protein CheV [Peptoclostridium litorale DSM 5388]SIO31254.1 two-component system, chemotaxis family, response regulator CheV [Peptoclostridium litorale DSM 5388]